jgi:hypothetical protein
VALGKALMTPDTIPGFYSTVAAVYDRRQTVRQECNHDLEFVKYCFQFAIALFQNRICGGRRPPLQ